MSLEKHYSSRVNISRLMFGHAMTQASLLETPDHAHLAGLMPALRAAMRRAAGADEGVGRKALVEAINAIARAGGVRLTGGAAVSISKDTLDKFLSPSDASHKPGIEALIVFVLATGDIGPLRVLCRAAGVHVVDAQGLADMEYGRACRMEREAKRRKRQLEGIL